MDEYQYPSFFEAKEKIRRYLLEQGDSGGGDCRMIKKTGGKTSKICFQEKEGIRLTVSRTNSPQTSDQPCSSQSQGPDNEVPSGAAKLDELIKKVQQKRVKLPTALLTFITSSGAISKYQTHFQRSLSNPVSLEVGSDLVLSSLSSDALDEAEAELQRDLTVANVKLHGATAVPPELDRMKEIMIKATDEANRHELRVDVSFIPVPSGTKVIKVRLVGYTENVNKLKEILHDYQMNQVKTEEALVKTFRQVFSKEQQGVRSPVVKNSTISSARPRPAIRKRKTPWKIVVNNMKLKIKLGSLEDEQVNVLVVPMLNKQLKSTQIGDSLLNKAGNAIKSKFDWMAVNRTLVPGDVLQVDAPPSLGCSKVFFIECTPWDGVRGQSVTALGNGLKRCLDLCVQQRFCSVAFPVIGSGLVLKYPLIEAIQLLTETIRQFGLSASSRFLSTIHIIIKPNCPDSVECYHDVYKHLSSNMNKGGQGTSCGHGTYFAVNASYSAQPTFSEPAADGTRSMFLARVLTGVYTLGHSDMKVPPPRSGLQPHDRYDSVVDRIKHPRMFIVFHDNQAYPDYLITFR